MKPSMLGLAVVGYFAYPIIKYQVFGLKTTGGPDGVTFVFFGAPVILTTAFLMSIGM